MSQKEIDNLVERYEKTENELKHLLFERMSPKYKEALFLGLKDLSKQKDLMFRLPSYAVIDFLDTCSKDVKIAAVKLLERSQIMNIYDRYNKATGEEREKIGKIYQEIQGILKNGQDVTRQEIDNDIKNLNESHDNIKKSKSAIKESRKGIINKKFERIKTKVSVKLLSVKQKINRLILLRTSDILENTEVLGKSKVGVFKKSIIKKYSEKLKKYEDDAKKIDDSYEKIDRLGEEIKGLEDKIKREKANIESEKVRAESLTEKLSREIPIKTRYLLDTEVKIKGLPEIRKDELKGKLTDPKKGDKVGTRPKKTPSQSEQVPAEPQNTPSEPEQIIPTPVVEPVKDPTPVPPKVDEPSEERVVPPIGPQPPVGGKKDEVIAPVNTTPTQDAPSSVIPPVKPPVQQDIPGSESVNRDDVVTIVNFSDLLSKLSTMGVKVQIGTLEVYNNNSKCVINGLQVNPALATGKVGKISMKGMVICQTCSEQVNTNSQNIVMEQPVQDAQLDNGHSRSRSIGGFVNIGAIVAFILLMLSVIIFVMD